MRGVTQPCDRDGEPIRNLWRNALNHFDRMRLNPYELKVDFSRKLIGAVMKKYKTAVACSFGKDSTVVVHLARQVDPDIPILFYNTGVECPETIKFKRLLTEEWHLNLIELHPEKNFWQCVEEYGYPKMRSGGGSPMCCWYLKEKPGYDWQIDNGVECVLMGLTYDESYTRRWTIIRYTSLWHVKRKEMWHCRPIGYWDTEMVWRYTRENNIPVNKAYQKGVKRVGCMPCTGYLSWREEMPKLSFPLYRRITKDMGQPVIEEWA